MNNWNTRSYPRCAYFSFFYVRHTYASSFFYVKCSRKMCVPRRYFAFLNICTFFFRWISRMIVFSAPRFYDFPPTFQRVACTDVRRLYVYILFFPNKGNNLVFYGISFFIWYMLHRSILVMWLECGFWIQWFMVQTLASVCFVLEQDTLSSLLQSTQL